MPHFIESYSFSVYTEPFFFKSCFSFLSFGHLSLIWQCHFTGSVSHELRNQCFLRLCIGVELPESFLVWESNHYSNKPPPLLLLVTLLKLLYLLFHFKGFSSIIYRKRLLAICSLIVMLVTEALLGHTFFPPFIRKCPSDLSFWGLPHAIILRT